MGRISVHAMPSLPPSPGILIISSKALSPAFPSSSLAGWRAGDLEMQQRHVQHSRCLGSGSGAPQESQCSWCPPQQSLALPWGHAQGCRVMLWGQEGAPPLWEAAQNRPGGREQGVMLRKLSSLWSQPQPEVGQGTWRDTEGHGGAHRTDRWLFSPLGTAPKDKHVHQGH